MNVKWLCLYCDFSVSKVCVKVVCVADGKTCQQPSVFSGKSQTDRQERLDVYPLAICVFVCVQGSVQ